MRVDRGGMPDTTMRVTCARCEAAYAPSLTGGTCPVCDAAPAGAEGLARRHRMWDDADGRLLAIVAAGTIGNVILLGILALLVLHS